jgi:hypothetical protein
MERAGLVSFWENLDRLCSGPTCSDAPADSCVFSEYQKWYTYRYHLLFTSEYQQTLS